MSIGNYLHSAGVTQQSDVIREIIGVRASGNRSSKSCRLQWILPTTGRNEATANENNLT
jgi:hypothetical protein